MKNELKIMKSTILILYCVFIYFDFIFCQEDINAEDLKLLGNYEIQSLRDFVRGKGRGFVSKVSVDRSAETSETADDILFEERQAQTAALLPPPPQPSQPFSIKMPPINNHDDVIAVGQKPEMEMSKFEIVPLSELLKPGESLVIPTFITPSTTTTPTTQRPKKRKHSRRPTTTEMPSTTEGPSNEDFEELAKILQRFRQSQTTPAAPPPSTATTPRPQPAPPTTPFHSIPKASIPRPHLRHQGLSTVVEQTIPEFQEFVVSPLREKWKGMASPLLPTSAEKQKNNLFGEINIRPSKFQSPPPPSTLPPTLIPMSEQSDLLFPQKPSGSDQLVAITQEEWEEKMREISRKLGNYLMSVKKKKEQEGTLSKGSYQVNGVQQQEFRPNMLNFGQGKTSSKTPIKHRASSKAYVTLLREGFFHQIESNQFSFVASITLIRDSGKVILVDTGLATDINGRTDLIQKLSRLNIAPPLVDYVITTHGHPDHSGNTNDFPDSIHYQGNLVHYRTKFNISELAYSNFTFLTPNVKLFKTPGHTSEDISVIVSNTDKYGTIAISGDIFISDKDIDFPMMWKKFSHDIHEQEHSRRELICAANFIVPGHGKVFKVTSEIKNGVNCGNSENGRNHGFSRGRFN